jgi:hypothetical protein
MYTSYTHLVYVMQCICGKVLVIVTCHVEPDSGTIWYTGESAGNGHVESTSIVVLLSATFIFRVCRGSENKNKEIYIITSLIYYTYPHVNILRGCLLR